MFGIWCIYKDIYVCILITPKRHVNSTRLGSIPLHPVEQPEKLK